LGTNQKRADAKEERAGPYKRLNNMSTKVLREKKLKKKKKKKRRAAAERNVQLNFSSSKDGVWGHVSLVKTAIRIP